MSDDASERDPTRPPEGGDRGLFSQLPRTRPGVRSPRRAGGKQQAARSTKSAGPGPAAMRAAEAAAITRDEAGSNPLDPPRQPREKAPPRREPPKAGREAPSESQPSRSLGPGSLEDLAWAGVAVTAEAATLGVRLLGRAVEAAKRATERS